MHSMNEERHRVIGGVDAHAQTHHAAVLDGRGRLLATRAFEVSAAPVVKQSVSLTIAKQLNRQLQPTDFELHVERGGSEEGFRSESDLSKRLGIDPLQAHELISKGILGVASLCQRIEFMQRFKGVTGFRADELPLFDAKLAFLVRELAPEAHAERFEHVLEISGLPEADPDPNTHDIDLPRLLEILNSDEVREFRSWIRSLDSLTDTEIKREISQLRDVVARSVRSTAGKAVRFSAITGVGLIPGGQLPAIGIGTSLGRRTQQIDT